MKLFFRIMAIFTSYFAMIQTFANEVPQINCYGLPGCKSDSKTTPSGQTIDGKEATNAIVYLIGEIIQYVTVVAVLALMISGVMYLFSGGEEEKVGQAKKWIIWSLVGVIVSLSAWMIISVLGNLSFISPNTP